MSTTKNYGLGRRKTSRAQVILTEDPASQSINGLMLADYFPTVSMQEAAVAALKLTSQLDQYGIKGKVSGGGKHSQAEAGRLAGAQTPVHI